MTMDARPSVLVVDDHAGFRAMARKVLEAAGFFVMEASNGVDATEIARDLLPSLVLLDVQLPGIDGFEVARRLATYENGPVVVLTSTREMSDYGDRVTSSPVAGFLPKDQLSPAVLQKYLKRDRR